MDTLGLEPSYRSGSVRCSTEAAAGAAAFVTLDTRGAEIHFPSAAMGLSSGLRAPGQSLCQFSFKLVFWRASKLDMSSYCRGMQAWDKDIKR